MAFRLTVCFLIATAIAITSVNCNSEGDALNAWKMSLIDPNNVLQSWDPTLVNPCTWFHISCDNNNRVTRVDVGNAGLQGPLVPQLGDLTYLQYFEVYENNLTGHIPSEFGKLRRLVSLDLYNNSLSGVIPSTLGKLTSLRFLRIDRNSFSGFIPASLGNLLSLGILNLNNNKLSGDLPIEVLSLVYRGNLRTLNVAGNMLVGTRSGRSTVTTIIQDPKARK